MLLDRRIPIGYILNKIKYDLIFVLLIGLIVNLLTSLVEGFLPDMPLAIPAFLGTSISVLLSFKINQSYDRWWEARKIWGSIVNDSRTLVLQLQGFIKEGNSKVIKTISYRQIAWCFSLGRALRGQPALEGLEKFLTPGELEKIGVHKNKALAIMQLNNHDISTLSRNEQVDYFGRLQLDNTLVRLCDSMGRAERIKTTVFPSTYRLFLHFIIYLFVITLAVSLHDVDLKYELPLLVVITSLFFLLEKSAYHLQDPFKNKPSDTPVNSIARTIEINIRQLLGETELPEPVKPEGFYVM